MIDTQACNITYKNVLPIQIKCQPLQSVWPKELPSFLSPLSSWVQVGLDKKGLVLGLDWGMKVQREGETEEEGRRQMLPLGVLPGVCLHAPGSCRTKPVLNGPHGTSTRFENRLSFK